MTFLGMWFFVGLVGGSASLHAEVIGTYQSVTESELHITLQLEDGGKANVRWVVHAVEEGEVSTTGQLKGTWGYVDRGHIAIDLEEGRALYEMMPCLSYESFGLVGCSAGLEPRSAEGEVRWLEQYPLWVSDMLVVPATRP